MQLSTPNFLHPMPTLMDMQNESIELSLVNLRPSPSVMLHLETCLPFPKH
jgi:hypothetical protein